MSSPLTRQTLTLLLVCTLTEAVRSDQKYDFFENKVRQLLAARCFACHGPDKQESDLRLDHRDGILQGGSSGDAAAVAGDASASLLIQYVRHEVEGMEMPPDDERLSDEEIVILQRWITGGLPWPDENAPQIQSLDQRLGEHRRSHWALQRPLVAPLDMVGSATSDASRQWSDWPQSGLDRYVLRRLLQNDMTPSPAAGSRTLLRRLKFDLLGLPPTFEEVRDFEQDTSPDRVARLVDRLLASPRYGEHWGRHWLDVARYADTRGYSFQRDRNYPWAYTYRDYVIRVLNEDLPFDQFVVEQLAADQLPLVDDNRALAALGFLTVGRKFNNEHDDIDDKIDVVTRGLLGLTVACARCHDHKYDAIPTEDYYSLYGVFASSQEAGDLPLIGDADVLRVAREFEQRFGEVERKLKEFDAKLLATVTKESHTRVTDYLVAAVGESDQAVGDLRPGLVESWQSFLERRATEYKPTLSLWAELRSTPDEEVAEAARALARRITANYEFASLNTYLRKAFVASPPTTMRELAELYGRVLSAAYDIWQQAGGTVAARSKQPAEVRQLLWFFSDPNSPGTINADRARKYATSDEKQQRKLVESAVAQMLAQTPAAYHRAMVMRDKPQPVTAYVFIRGQAGRRGDEVLRQAPALLAGAQRKPFEQGSGRLELARQIVDDDNPLTARVFVNRVWMHHFGQPLVSTPSDFGIRSDPPLQQDLLDYLARRFVENDWSVKWLHREILLSGTYQQASGDRPACYAVDPDNTLLWRMNRKRLGFEATRDALLAVSKQLDLSMGGKPAKLFSQPRNGPA